jgi:hypothetical protein
MFRRFTKESKMIEDCRKLYGTRNGVTVPFGCNTTACAGSAYGTRSHELRRCQHISGKHGTRPPQPALRTWPCGQTHVNPALAIIKGIASLLAKNPSKHTRDEGYTVLLRNLTAKAGKVTFARSSSASGVELRGTKSE